MAAHCIEGDPGQSNKKKNPTKTAYTKTIITTWSQC